MVDVLGLQFSFGLLELLLSMICAAGIAMAQKQPRRIVIGSALIFGTLGMVFARFTLMPFSYPANPNVLRIGELISTIIFVFVLALKGMPALPAFVDSVIKFAKDPDGDMAD